MSLATTVAKAPDISPMFLPGIVQSIVRSVADALEPTP